MARWTVSPIRDLPAVSDSEPGEPVWHPLQHALGIDTFGANVFVAREADQVLVEEHDERESGQQELYVVLEGTVLFELNGEEIRLEHGDALAVTDPEVRRRGIGRTAGTMLLIVGAGEGPFKSSWNPAHFADIPRPT
jgi:GNAT superfamily N-acetyltransferase